MPFAPSPICLLWYVDARSTAHYGRCWDTFHCPPALSPLGRGLELSPDGLCAIPAHQPRMVRDSSPVTERGRSRTRPSPENPELPLFKRSDSLARQIASIRQLSSHIRHDTGIINSNLACEPAAAPQTTHSAELSRGNSAEAAPSTATSITPHQSTCLKIRVFDPSQGKHPHRKGEFHLPNRQKRVSLIVDQAQNAPPNQKIRNHPVCAANTALGNESETPLQPGFLQDTARTGAGIYRQREKRGCGISHVCQGPLEYVQ